MATLYITLQGKGGIGKSYVTCVFAQYLMDKGEPITVIDTDTVNPTLIHYKPLRTQHLQLSEKHVINPRALDALMKIVEASAHDANIIVDVGSSGFETLMAYAAENDLFALLEAMGHRIIINTIIAGGPDAEETAKGVMSILDTTAVPIILWLNEHIGPLLIDGKPIQQARFLNAQEHRLLGLIVLHKKTPATFGKDIADMLSARLTFAEALASGAFDIMPRSRIKRVREEIYQQLDELTLPGEIPPAQEAAQ